VVGVFVGDEDGIDTGGVFADGCEAEQGLFLLSPASMRMRVCSVPTKTELPNSSWPEHKP